MLYVKLLYPKNCWWSSYAGQVREMKFTDYGDFKSWVNYWLDTTISKLIIYKLRIGNKIIV